MVATPAAPLGSGSYLVEWTTISRDDDELARGTWTFTVAVAPSPSPTPVATAAPTASAAPCRRPLGRRERRAIRGPHAAPIGRRRDHGEWR